MSKNPRGKTQAQQVTVIKPHPMLWQAALRQADGDAKRIEIVSETNLIVHPGSSRPDQRSQQKP